MKSISSIAVPLLFAACAGAAGQTLTNTVTPREELEVVAQIRVPGESGEHYLYIVDSGNNRVALMLSSSVVGTSGSFGNALGQFSGAVNLGVGVRGIYVAETGNNRIQAFDPIKSGHGESPVPFVARLGYSSGLSLPNAVASIQDFLAEKLYIADTGNDRILKVTLPETSTPDATWNTMKSSVALGNLEAAAACFASGSAERYRAAYLSIGAPALAPVISQIPTLSPVAIEGDSAQYRFDRVIEGITITFPVEFVKENGVWKILEF